MSGTLSSTSYVPAGAELGTVTVTGKVVELLACDGSMRRSVELLAVTNAPVLRFLSVTTSLRGLKMRAQPTLRMATFTASTVIITIMPKVAMTKAINSAVCPCNKLRVFQGGS